MNTRTPRHSALRVPHSAFTRTELLLVLAVVSLLVAIVLPALAHDRSRSARILCANNLRQVGAGIQIWGNDHGDQPPWDVPLEEGGTKLHPLAANVWFHFAWLSNELNSAKILFCPSDVGRMATTFNFSPEVGYLHANFRANATSYLLIHSASLASPGMVLADRNVGSDRAPGGCPFFGSAFGISGNFRPYRGAFQWNTNLHGAQGNVLSTDGGVSQLSNDGLRDTVSQFPLFDAGTIHFITPR